MLPEVGVWHEGTWDESRWANDDLIEEILFIISSGSFPRERTSLTTNELHQLRDALTSEAHAAHRREIFVSNDTAAFIKHGRREQLESLLATRILTIKEFLGEL
jgi:hypothetical protein